MDANMGARKSDNKKQNPVVMAVSPVRPPSATPAPLSMKAVTGEVPKTAPMDMQIASVQKATVERGKSWSEGRTLPQKRAMEYRVAVQSMMSTYKNVNKAIANRPGSPPRFHCS